MVSTGAARRGLALLRAKVSVKPTRAAAIDDERIRQRKSITAILQLAFDTPDAVPSDMSALLAALTAGQEGREARPDYPSLSFEPE